MAYALVTAWLHSGLSPSWSRTGFQRSSSPSFSSSNAPGTPLASPSYTHALGSPASYPQSPSALLKRDGTNCNATMDKYQLEELHPINSIDQPLLLLSNLLPLKFSRLLPGASLLLFAVLSCCGAKAWLPVPTKHQSPKQMQNQAQLLHTTRSKMQRLYRWKHSLHS